MPTPAKEQTVEELNDVFTRAKSAVLAYYHGMSAENMTALRTHMRERAIDFRVVKNTLARKAAKNTSLEVLDSEFKGPVSLVVSFDDAVAPAKALSDFAKTGAEKTPEVVTGVVEGQRVSPEEIKALADLPSKEVLLSQMLSVFQGPTTNFVGVFSALLRKLVGTLDAIKEQKSQG
ncbi:MAG: 50S ribosomal protein L10 [Nitrospinaceae bacterium]|nr:50S ribosomal protein L10 [Nitrospinaceae bacterium]NIR54536.1 50S ribosomal protein L10 [Nitrospinaceae bacterium]NIS84955.1 50S ribosomal protein L10 [Nitrospinaceae bacterium]NIT81769.1 50S ribosomal protein L10 [Nitrospinaceae bacterium]NIU44038.1 50S ribosomal protein L10 [Nitrospinaceae bacterium]